MTRRSSRLRAFRELLDIDEVLPIKPGRWLTFEYIGPADWFGECPGLEWVRGARCTSIDEAFRPGRGTGWWSSC